MTVSLYDDFHDMVVEMDHDGAVITGVAGEMRRFPKTTCPGATALLPQFVGCEIALGRGAIAGQFSRGAHCTHLIDMAALGVSALGRDVADQCFEQAVTDPDADGCQTLRVELNGEQQLCITLRDECIITPAEYAGRSLFGGFGRWADAHFSGLERDLWHMAQMAVFIAHGRKFIVDSEAQIAVTTEPTRKGACFSYSDPSFETAVDMVDFVRDHTAGLPPRDPGQEKIMGHSS